MKKSTMIVLLCLILGVLGACNQQNQPNHGVQEIKLYELVGYEQVDDEPIEEWTEKEDVDQMVSILQSAKKMDGILDIEPAQYRLDLIEQEANPMFLWLRDDTTEAILMERTEDGTEVYYTLLEEETSNLNELFNERGVLDGE
ncbi:hypothetical protein MKX54_05520 [Alkalihalobacillus sp. FSL R5-0424]